MSMSEGREFQAEGAAHANTEATSLFEEYEERGKESNLQVNRELNHVGPCRSQLNQ